MSRADSGFETLPSQRSRCFGELVGDVTLVELVDPELVEPELVVVGAHAVFPNVQPLPLEPLSPKLTAMEVQPRPVLP